MTVEELIVKLALCYQTMRVFVRGYEGGLADPVFKTADVAVNGMDDASYSGPHCEYEERWHDAEKVFGVIIDRDGR